MNPTENSQTPPIENEEQQVSEFTPLRMGAILAPALLQYMAKAPTRRELLGRRRVIELEIQNLTKERDALEQRLYPSAS